MTRCFMQNLRLHFPQGTIAATAWIAPNATVLGDVTIADQASVWFQSVIRGDVESIRIGCGTNIQDLCVLHADEGFPCLIGARVTVGHAAIVHGAVVEDDVMIGMRAVVMNGARIGSGSIVGVGSIVTEGTIVPPGSVVLGVPAKIKRPVETRDRDRIRHAAEHYIRAAEAYRLHFTAGQPAAARIDPHP